MLRLRNKTKKKKEDEESKQNLNKNKLRQFIYYDYDVINSIIAQKDNGIIIEKSKENASKNDNGFAVGVDASRGVINLLKLKGNFKYDRGKSIITKDIVKEAISDSAFNYIYEYIKPSENNLNNKEENYGKCIKLTRCFDFVDFDYLRDALGKDGIRKMFDSNQRNSFQEAENVISVFNKLIPYSHILTSYDGYLIPLEEKYCRINPSSLGFKYGGKMHCVGIVTNIIKKNIDNKDSINSFTTYQHTLNETLCNILQTKYDNICIVHPIAVYYEIEN